MRINSDMLKDPKAISMAAMHLIPFSYRIFAFISREICRSFVLFSPTASPTLQAGLEVTGS